ncbi:MAG TPA: hypothetical protein P5293_05065 [Bacteroidales bacterium]|nr:hypothetical protein [Bacteroidales bacterium]
MKIDRIMNKYLSLVEADYSDTIQLLQKQIRDSRKLMRKAIEDTDDSDKKEQIRKRGTAHIESLQKRIESYQERAKAEREREKAAKK